MVYDLQRASMWKRFSAWLLDKILLVILFTGFLWLLSLITHYDKYNDEYNDYVKAYETAYGTDFNYSRDEYEALPDEERQRYDAAYDALIHDTKVVSIYNSVKMLTLTNISLSLLLAYLILEFIVPLFLKNGQTIGKKIFNLGLMRVDGVRLTPVQLFVRTLIGKFAIEAMVPTLLIIMISLNTIGGVPGIIIIFGILALNCGIMVATRTNSCIHDVFAGTVVIDLPSQMIFDTAEELIHYKEAYAAEQAERKNY